MRATEGASSESRVVLYSLPGCDGDARGAGCFVLVWGEALQHHLIWLGNAALMSLGEEIGQRSTNALQNCNVKYAVSSLSATDKREKWSERKKRGEGKESDIAVKCTCPLPPNSPDGREYAD